MVTRGDCCNISNCSGEYRKTWPLGLRLLLETNGADSGTVPSSTGGLSPDPSRGWKDMMDGSSFAGAIARLLVVDNNH